MFTPARVLGCLSVLSLVAGVAACSAPPPIEHPVSLSFRPTRSGEQLWLATPFAVEVVTEREARDLESVDPMYVGELKVHEGAIPKSQVGVVAQIAAEQGATHFRVVCAGAGLRMDVVLYRVERDRWSSLPDAIRPVPPAGTVIQGDPLSAL